MNRLASPVRLPNLDEEDSSYVLRELELNAFTAVVSAMRAQGVLNDFKEVVLESLKCLFFIPDELYKAEIRKAANDEFLSKVATVLNPSYDTFTPWGMTSREAEEDRTYFPPARLFDTKAGTSSTRSVADLLLQGASSHNDVVAGHDIMLASLLQTPKAPFVPERLRKLLRDTESLPSERVLPKTAGDRDEFLNRVILRRPPPPPKPTLLPKRKRKMRQNGYKEVSYDEEITDIPGPEKPLTSAAPAPLHSPPKQDATTALLNLLPAKDSEPFGVKELMNKIQAQMEEEKMNGMLESNGRRKRKPRAAPAPKELQPECARARPFRFGHRNDGIKRMNPSPMKRPATPAASPIGPPRSPPGANGSIAAQVMPPVALQSPAHQVHLNKASPRHPSAIAAHMISTPGHKENASVHLRQLPSSAVGSVNHVISRVPSVPPATTPTGVIKRPRVASFTETTKITTSPVDLTQRSTALRKATCLPPTNKVKVAVTPPVEVHGQAMPAIPNSKPVYPHTVSVTVNRPQNRTIALPKDSTGMTVIAPRPAGVAVPQTSAAVNELHGHDYSLPKPATLIKKTVITTPGTTTRIINGGQTIVHKAIPSTSNHPAQIVSQQVVNVVKKITTAPVALTAASPAPLITTVHRPSPPPNALSGTSGTIVGRKFIQTTGQGPTSTASQISVGQYLRKVATSSPQPSTAEGGPPPVKRVFFCDPNNPTVATVHTEPVIPKEEKKESATEGSTPSTPAPRLYKIAAPRIDGPMFAASSSTSEPQPPPQQPQERPEVIQQSLMEIT